MVGEKLSVLVLTEDTGDDAHAVITAICTKIMFLIAPLLDERRLQFRPATKTVQAGMNCYKSRKLRDNGKKVDLVQAIADHLLGGDGRSVVFVHVDGDRRWSERTGKHLCDNAQTFDTEILRRVRALLETRGQGDKIEQLVMLVPFWSVESWLFQNTEEALRICAETHPRYKSAVSHFERWRDYPQDLDEHEQPKDSVKFGAKYNRRLAENGFPAKRLRQLGLSFAHAVERAERSRLRLVVARAARDASASGRE